mgnify:CR=1 FL=1
MVRVITAALVASLLSGCIATTPTTPTTPTSVPVAMPTEQVDFAWFCYGSPYDAEFEAESYIFYAYSGASAAYVNLHGEDLPATLEMDGLDAWFVFGRKALIIAPDGRERYGDLEENDGFLYSDSYFCRKSPASR